MNRAVPGCVCACTSGGVLGIRVRGKVPDEFTVPLTVCQNRFLFNSLGGGFINVDQRPSPVRQPAPRLSLVS